MRNHHRGLLLLLSCLSLSLIAFGACGDDGEEPPAEDNNGGGDTFASTALPIFAASCNFENCHGGGGFLGGGLSLETFDGLKNGRDGTFSPCDAEGSTVITKLSNPAPFGSPMPLGSDPLSADQIEALTNWVNAGSDVTPLCN